MDRRNLLTLEPAARIAVIPPRGPATPPLRPPGEESPRKESVDTLLFAGNFMHPPNVDAAMWLAEEILPRVRLRHPDALLQLVGASPPASVRRLAGPGVAVTGMVPDVAVFLNAATVVVAPLRLGGGIRVKVIDALVFGKPVVATPLAAEGLNVSDRRELLLAEGHEAFADAISSLLSDAPLRRDLSANAQVWAEKFGAKGRVGSAFERLYESLVPADSRSNRLNSSGGP